MLNQPQDIVAIHEDASRYYLYDGKIVVHEANGNKRDMVNALVDSTIETAENWSLETPYTELLDARRTQITPYARQKVSELSKRMGTIKGHTAVLVDNTPTGRMMTFFINTIFVRFSPQREIKVFTDFGEAVTWLKDSL